MCRDWCLIMFSQHENGVSFCDCHRSQLALLWVHSAQCEHFDGRFGVLRSAIWAERVSLQEAHGQWCFCASSGAVLQQVPPHTAIGVACDHVCCVGPEQLPQHSTLPNSRALARTTIHVPDRHALSMHCLHTLYLDQNIHDQLASIHRSASMCEQSSCITRTHRSHRYFPSEIAVIGEAPSVWCSISTLPDSDSVWSLPFISPRKKCLCRAPAGWSCGKWIALTGLSMATATTKLAIVCQFGSLRATICLSGCPGVRLSPASRVKQYAKP